MAASILSFGMLTARAFWIVRRRVGLEAGSAPPDLTAMVMSLAMRANCFAMRFQRANIVCLRTSNMRPMARMVPPSMRGVPALPQRRDGRDRKVREERSGARCAPRARLLSELGVQDAQAPALQVQAALDLAQL